MRQGLLLLGMLLVMTLGTSCVRAPQERVEWPDDLPPMDHYERIYASDVDNQAVQPREKYLMWVVRFYKGWRLYQDGWHMTTRDVLHSMDDGAQKDRMRSKMAHLGKLISGEWAKNSVDRRIRSRELSIWGQALLEAINRGQEETLIDQVTRDVDGLLSGRLEPGDISLQRYQRTSASIRTSGPGQAVRISF